MVDEDNISLPEDLQEIPLDAQPETAPEAEALVAEAGAEPGIDFPSDPAQSSFEESPDAPENGDEGFDSNADVDELLSAELLAEGLEPPPVPEALLTQVPSFQLRFQALTAELRPALKKLLEAQGVSMGEKTWEASAPVVSQLTEFQAIALYQAARALGASTSGKVQLPEMLPTEDDLALGDLSAVPEPTLLFSEAAPSVTLPKGEKDVLLCTPDRLPGGTVQESFGLVLAHRSIARRLFREEELREKLEKELNSVPNRPAASIPSSHLQMVLRDLAVDLRKHALARGANAVLGVKLEAFTESGGSDPQLEQLRLVAFGTAAVVEKT